MGTTAEIAAFAADTPATAIPADVSARALALVSDFVGSIVRAAAESESTPSLLAMTTRAGLGAEGPCTVFGLDRTFGPAAAALLNGALGHSLDFDDTHADSSLHPSAPVFPAALAAAESFGGTGAELIAAVVIGFEVCCRLGNALDPTAHYARGFHPTATAGVFGATVAAGRILKLNSAQMASALGIAACQASGSLQFLENGAWTKRYQVGEASMKGLMAAILASEGFVGAQDAIEGRHGFLRGYTDDAKTERATERFGQVWQTMKIGLKPYPSCRYTHAAVDGLLRLRAEQNLDQQTVERVVIGLHQNGIKLVGDPLNEKRRARSVVEGQFSMPFVGAVALLRGEFGWDDYGLLGEPAVESLADRIEVVREPSLEGRDHPFGASIRITSQGVQYDLEIADPSGEPELFPSEAARKAKFEALTKVRRGLPDRLLARLAELRSASSVGYYFKQPSD